MAAAGWYPDPSGAVGQYRYWDGSAWSAHTTADPRDAPSQPPRQPNNKRGGKLAVLVAIVLALGLIVWLLVGRAGGATKAGFVPEDTNTSTPNQPGWDETSTPSSPPPTQASMTRCPITQVSQNTNQGNDGRLHGGGLSVSKIKGWSDVPLYLNWISDFHTQVTAVYPGWMSNIGVGALNKVDGFADPKMSAAQTMMCFATTDYYTGYTDRKDLINKQYDVSGYYGWRMQTDIHVALPNLPRVSGDRVDVIVVDLGRDYLGVFVSSVTIGDAERTPLVDAAIASLRVDS